MQVTSYRLLETCNLQQVTIISLLYQNFPHFYSMFLTNLYKVISFILLPFGALLGFVSFFALFMALGNFAILLPLAITICTTIYIFSSFIFVIKGIINQKQCKSSLKDWMKVNAYVTMFFATSCVTNFIMLKTNPQLKAEFSKQALAMQKNVPADAAAMMPQIINGILVAMLFLGVSLLLHISLSFAFIKTKSNLFEEE